MIVAFFFGDDMPFTDRDMAEIRSVVEEWMTYACEIRRPGTQSYNDTTLESTFTEGALVYSGKCRVTPSSGSAVFVGGNEFPTRYTTIYIPHGSTAPKVDDEIEITDGNGDTEVEGRKFQITQVNFKTWQPSIEISAFQIGPSSETTGL